MKRPRPKPSPDYARVRRQTFRIDQLEEAPYNARSITAEALKGLVASLEQFGVLALPIVNVAHDPPRIVGGHQRISALRRLGHKEVECVIVKLDETRERQANFTLNSAHIEGHFVPELTRVLLEELTAVMTGGTDFTDLRLDNLLRQIIRDTTQTPVDRTVGSGKVDDDVGADIPKSSAVSKVGRVYALGEHRIHCGKIAAPTPVDGVGLSMAFSTLTNLPEQASVEIIDLLLKHTLNSTRGAVYVATSNAMMPLVQSRFVECGGYFANTILTYPTEPAPKTTPFYDVSIPLLYGWRDGQAHAFHGQDDQSNVWRVGAKMIDAAPVQAVVRAILNSSMSGEAVFDACADGGTTVIACEKTGRKLYGYVSSPREVDRVRRRWAEFVHGKDADWKSLTAVA